MKTEEILSVIAHYEMAAGIEASVPGMEGFAAFYQRKLNPSERALLARYQKMKQTAHDDLAAMIGEGKRK
ncbi:MAG: hypothetical protein P4L99_21815 [Chthoniobacter sp.]|nr:hypothetical protein [Chthoniobacter sp.]